MGMKMTTPKAQIDAYINRKLDEWVEECISNLEFVGEECVAHVRSLPSLSRADFPNPKKIPPQQPHFIDLTGSLRNSVGYVVVKDGEIKKKGGFESGKPGAEEGAKYAESLVSRYPEGIVLIVVAGMNYAAYVSAKGYDVFDSAELKAESILKKMFANG